MTDFYLGIDTASQVEPTSLKKVALAKRVGAFLSADHAPEEIAAVTDLARVLSRDVEDSVRVALAFELRASTHVPKDLAVRIAKDVENVAAPFLKSTPVLSDTDLAELVPEIAEYARVAVAKREGLGVQTIDSLVNNGETASVSQLARNKKITMPAQSLSKLYNRFQGSEQVMAALSGRSDLPMALVDRLANRVADAAADTLVDRYGLKMPVAKKTTTKAAQRAMFTKLKTASADQVRAFVNDLRQRHRLTDELIIDAAREGVTEFVEAAVAISAGLTIGQASAILREGVPQKVIPLLRDAEIDRENMAALIKELAASYKGGH